MEKSGVESRKAVEASLSKAVADSAVSVMFSASNGVLSNWETVRIAGFGTFSKRARALREGRNLPIDGRIASAVPARPPFMAGKAPRDAVTTGPQPGSADGDDGSWLGVCFMWPRKNDTLAKDMNLVQETVE